MWGSNCRSNLSPEPAPPASQLSCCFFCPVGTRLGVCVCRPTPPGFGAQGSGGGAGGVVCPSLRWGRGARRASRVGVPPASCAFSRRISHENPCFVPAGPAGRNVTHSQSLGQVTRRPASAPGSGGPFKACAHVCTHVYVCTPVCSCVCSSPSIIHLCTRVCGRVRHAPPPSVCGWLGSALGPDARERCSGSRRGLAGAVPAHAARPPPSLATGLA